MDTASSQVGRGPSLAAFLKARLDEDEAAAKAVEDNSAPWDGQWQPRERHALETYNGWVLASAGSGGGRDFQPGVVEHMARHDPARALREVAAKRAILAELQAQNGGDPWSDPWSADADYIAGLAFAVSALAAVYSDHPDYRQEWKPSGDD